MFGWFKVNKEESNKRKQLHDEIKNEQNRLINAVHDLETQVDSMKHERRSVDILLDEVLEIVVKKRK